MVVLSSSRCFIQQLSLLILPTSTTSCPYNLWQLIIPTIILLHPMYRTLIPTSHLSLRLNPHLSHHSHLLTSCWPLSKPSDITPNLSRIPPNLSLIPLHPLLHPPRYCSVHCAQETQTCQLVPVSCGVQLVRVFSLPSPLWIHDAGIDTTRTWIALLQLIFGTF